MGPKEYLESLLKLPRLSSPSVSPDGKWVAWTWFNLGPVGDVYVALSDGSEEAFRLTDTGQNTWVASWLPDSKGLVVHHDHDGDEKDQLFQIMLNKPYAMQSLTDKSPSYFIRGGQIHPNNPWLFYAANYDFDNNQTIEASWIYRQDLVTGKKVAVAKPKKAMYFVPKLNSNGTHVLYCRKDIHPAGEQIWLVEASGQKDREIINLGAEVKVSASWCPDGERIVVLAENSTYKRLGIWSLTDERLAWLIDNPKRNIEFAWMPFNSDLIVIEEVKNARPKSSLLDPNSLKEIPFPEFQGNFIALAPTSSATKWIGMHYSSVQPLDVGLINLKMEDSKPISLTKVWSKTKLSTNDLKHAEDFWWKSVDGLKIQGWLYKTQAASIGMIVYVHGGPTGHSEDFLNPEIQYLVSQGFNVLDPNYRGSTGFGLPFEEAIKEDGWGGKEQEDIVAGIKALIKAGVAIEGKVGITGTSYGGYSAWYTITHYPKDLIAAAAPICGMTDLAMDYETTRPDLRPYSEEMMGGKPSEIPDKYIERSPINYIKDIHGSLLIIQGLNDPNVTPSNVYQVEKILRSQKIEYEKLLFEDEGHGINKPENLHILYTKLADFFTSAFQK